MVCLSQFVAGEGRRVPACSAVENHLGQCQVAGRLRRTGSGGIVGVPEHAPNGAMQRPPAGDDRPQPPAVRHGVVDRVLDGGV